MWFKVDCSFFRNPKIELVGRGAAWAYLQGLAYAMEHLTDGHIPYRQACRWACTADLKRLTSTQSGQQNPLWIIVETGYQIHGYLDYNQSKAQIDRRRAGERDRKARQRSDVTP